MNLLLQQILVSVLVVASVLLSAWRLASVATRLRMLDIFAAVPGLRALPWLGRLRARNLARRTSACGGCSQAAKPGAPSPNQTPGALRR